MTEKILEIWTLLNVITFFYIWHLRYTYIKGIADKYEELDKFLDRSLKLEARIFNELKDKNERGN